MSEILFRLFFALQQRLVREERGVTTVEYALVVVFIAGAVTALMTILNGKITALFNGISL